MRPARHPACASSNAAGQARRPGRRRGSADCGWVTLTGRVTREYAKKERAEEDALEVLRRRRRIEPRHLRGAELAPTPPPVMPANAGIQ